MSRVHIIWNPISGAGAGKAAFEKIAAYLADAGVDFSESMSAYPGHAVELAGAARDAGHGVVLAVGGDGTVREVASAMAFSDTPMGIIPSGTGNDLIRPLGIPKDPVEALKIALGGTVRRMDAARINGKMFFNVAGFGFDVDVLDYVELYKKRIKNGSLAYLCGLVRAIGRGQLRKTRIETPEGVLEKNVLILAVGNGTHFGGGMCVAPKADPFDGLLDVCVAHDVSLFSLILLLPKFIKGKHLNNKHVTYFRTTHLSAVCEPESRIDVDGEVLPGTPIEVDVLPGALLVMIP